VFDDRPTTRFDVDAETERVVGDDDVGEENRRVDAITPDGLEGHFGSHVRLRDGIEDGTGRT
jgi:hypothetical protein